MGRSANTWIGQDIDGEKRDPKKVCGAKTSHGPCQQWKGAGTDHKGAGSCKNHGGATRNHKTKAETEQAIERMRTFGLPIDVEPHEALLEEIRRTAGHVAWLGGRVAELEDAAAPKSEDVSTTSEPLLVQTMFGPKPSVWIGIYQQERQHLARVCKMALDACVAERQVRVAEAQGELLASVIKTILGDLGLNKNQQANAPAIVRRHLLALAG